MVYAWSQRDVRQSKAVLAQLAKAAMLLPQRGSVQMSTAGDMQAVVDLQLHTH